MADETATVTWLVVSVSTAGAAASLRVQVWRKLRSLGALYLQQSVCLLPAITGLNAARDAEYTEVLHRLPELHRELAGEQARDYFGAAFENAALDAETSGPAQAAGPGRSGLRAVDGP